MHASNHAVAKIQVRRAMLEGCAWREAMQAAGLQVSRATAYRLRQRMLAGGEDAWRDRRQGHASKVCGAVRTWLEAYNQQHRSVRLRAGTGALIRQPHRSAPPLPFRFSPHQGEIPRVLSLFAEETGKNEIISPC